MLTAYESPELVSEASAAGAAAYVTKPPDRGELQRAITIATARFADLQELRRLNGQLQKALAEVKTLSGLLPICARCKNIRDDRGYWTQVEAYVETRTAASFSHSICPDCLTKLYPEYFGDDRGSN